MDLHTIATETQEIRGKLSHCRSCIRTAEKRLADLNEEQAALNARLDVLEREYAQAFVMARNAEPAPEPFPSFGEPERVAAE